jgi:hypothetical protein
MAAHFAGSTACAGTLAQNITTAATPKARKSFIWGTFHPAFQTVARGAMVAMRASAGKQPARAEPMFDRLSTKVALDRRAPVSPVPVINWQTYVAVKSP